MDIIHREDTWLLRLATEKDNERLCELFRQVDMAANLNLAEERDPDFFALHTIQTTSLQKAQSYTKIYEDISDPLNPYIFGCGTVVVRDAWLDGKKCRVGYACDLRIEPAYRQGRIFPIGFQKFFDYVTEKESLAAMYFAILSDNKQARNAFFSDKTYRQNQPLVKQMTAYDMVSIQLVGPVAKPLLPVRRATEHDINEISNFIANKQQRRQFGFVFDKQLLLDRLRLWPNFSINDFFLAHNQRGQLVGCTAPWDTETHVRRSRVVKYGGKMQVLRQLYNIEARIRQFPCLPAAGECFHLVSLTHLEIENDSPLILNSLLRGIYADYKDKDLHFISLFMPKGSALAPALKGFRTQKIAMELMSMVSPQSSGRENDYLTLHPGFEMALH